MVIILFSMYFSVFGVLSYVVYLESGLSYEISYVKVVYQHIVDSYHYKWVEFTVRGNRDTFKCEMSVHWGSTVASQ